MNGTACSGGDPVEPTMGEVCDVVKAASPDWVPIGGGFKAKWIGEVDMSEWLGREPFPGVEES